MAFLLSCTLQILILLIKLYQLLISPLLGPHCRFNPSCSRYGIKVLYHFGLIKGSWLIIKRVLKCHPLYNNNNHSVLLKLDNQNREC